MSAADDLNKFIDKIGRVLTDAGKSENLMPVAEKAIEIIRTRTRLGYGVGPGTSGTGDRFKLASLSSSYILHRKRNAGRLSSFTSPSRSNLTFSGQMLQSMTAVFLAPGSVVIDFTGSRSDGEDNAQIAKYVSGKRPFLNLSKNEVEQLKSFHASVFGDLLDSRRLT